MKISLAVIVGYTLVISSSFAKPLTLAELFPALNPAEIKIMEYIDDHSGENADFIEHLVNINSGTINSSGVTDMANLIEPRLKKLGFKTWREHMFSVGRGPHLFASHKGGGPKILLIGHLDTAFEKNSGFLRWKNLGNGIANGPGAADMKGGNIAIVEALEALQYAGELSKMNITVALMGDGESPWKDADGSYTTTRAKLIELAKQSDYAFGFEPTYLTTEKIKTSRKGRSKWVLKLSSQGKLAVYPITPITQILNRIYQNFRSDKNLTFNIESVISGAKNETKVSGVGSTIIANAEATGGLLFSSQAQLTQTKIKIKKILEKEMAFIHKVYSPKEQISAEMTFIDHYPAMEETKENRELLKLFSKASLETGYGPVTSWNDDTGAPADISFAAPYVKGCLDGLGPLGIGVHSKNEILDFKTMPVVAMRAALLLYRLQKYRK